MEIAAVVFTVRDSDDDYCLIQEFGSTRARIGTYTSDGHVFCNLIVVTD